MPMLVDTLAHSHHPAFADWSQCEPSLVRLSDAGVPVVASGGRAGLSFKWPVRFLLTAALGAVGGLVAAIAMHPLPLAMSSPSQVVSEVAPATESNAAIPPATTTVLVPVNARADAAASTSDEVTRLRDRNKRLEALVRVLRQREAPPSARN